MSPKFASSFKEHQIYEDRVVLRPWTNAAGVIETLTATGTGAIEAVMPGDVRSILARFHCTPVLAVGDTLDMYVQTLFTCSGVPIWVDVIHFEQILGNGVTVVLHDKIAISLDEGFFEIGTALAVDTQRNLIGEAWRARWVVAGATPDFICSVVLYPM